MKLFFKFLGAIGFILFLCCGSEGITLAQIIVMALVSITLIAIAVIGLSFLNGESFRLDFEDDNGHHKHIKARNIIAKWLAIGIFYTQGYRVCREIIYGYKED